MGISPEYFYFRPDFLLKISGRRSHFISNPFLD